MRILKYLKNPYQLVVFFGNRRMLRWMSDRTFLKLRYRAKTGKKLNLENPKTFTEKLQWMKLYDRRDLYTMLVDKAQVKDFVKATIGEEYLIPTLGIWDRGDQIQLDRLPREFVLKCTHDSGGMLICRDKSKLDWKQAQKKLEKARKKIYFWINREWSYKNVVPRIIAEPYMEDSRTGELQDYKFFCFNGVPKLMFVATDRQKKDVATNFDFFDMDFNHLDLYNVHPHAAVTPEKPKNFELMKDLAAKLSQGLPHVRVDLYEVDGRVYFGEMTFYHCSGMLPFDPEEWDHRMGEWLVLPEKRE